MERSFVFAYFGLNVSGLSCPRGLNYLSLAYSPVLCGERQRTLPRRQCPQKSKNPGLITLCVQKETNGSDLRTRCSTCFH